ncbi:MAG: transglutaminase-like domain-containing protein [Ruminococcus sp.]|jgi:hypothetical protein|nr:transglutaminase-like domain-containing protein [Ruminococcus sp.]
MNNRKIKRLLSSILSILFVLVITNLAVTAEEEEAETEATAPYFYDALTDDEKAGFDTLKKAISETADIATLSVKLSKESAERVIALAQYYDPEIFHLNTVKAINEGERTLFHITYRMDADQLAAAWEKINTKTDEILSVVDAKESTYSKMKAIHDEIVSGCRYSDSHGERLSMYGALISGRANSFGYAKAFTFIAKKAGIESFVNIAYKDGKTYARSSVYYSERWYNIDCSKNDGLSRYKEHENYAYFLVPDSYFTGCTPYSTYFTSPLCTDGTRYFYRSAKLEAKDNPEARQIITDLMISASKQKMNTIYFSFADDASLDYFLRSAATTAYVTNTLNLAKSKLDHEIITDFADVSVNKTTRVVTMVFFYTDSTLSDYYTTTDAFSKEHLSFFNSYGLK